MTSSAYLIISAAVALLLGTVLGWRIAAARSFSGDGERFRKSKLSVTALVAVLCLLVLGAGLLIFLFQKGDRPDPEIQMSILVVASIASLMTVLFIVAAGFSAMRLTDARQPLGLPEGSIRAMIALVLVMVFIIFGIYLFRVVGNGNSTFIGKMAAQPDPKTYPDKLIYFEKTSDGMYNVWAIAKVSDDGARLAQQLVTTVGTLVVAVAGFYFGSSTATTAASAATGGTLPPINPSIKTIVPVEGRKEERVGLEILGSGFKSPVRALLNRGSDIIPCTDVVATPEKVTCKVLLNQDPDTRWDVVIENADGKEARAPQAFRILA